MAGAALLMLCIAGLAALILVTSGPEIVVASPFANAFAAKPGVILLLDAAEPCPRCGACT